MSYDGIPLALTYTYVASYWTSCTFAGRVPFVPFCSVYVPVSPVVFSFHDVIAGCAARCTVREMTQANSMNPRRLLARIRALLNCWDALSYSTTKARPKARHRRRIPVRFLLAIVAVL